MATLNELMIDGQWYRINIAGTYDVWSEEYCDWKPWFPTYRWDQDFKTRLKAERANQRLLEFDLRSSAVESNLSTETEPTTFRYDHGLEVPLTLPLMEGSATSFKRVGNLTLERNDGQLYRVRQGQVERLENGQWLRSHTTYVPYIRQIAQEFYPIETWNDRPKELEGGFVRMYWRTLETVVLWGRRLKWVVVGR